MNEGRKRIIRIVVAALGLTALLALQPESARLVESAWARSGSGAARAPIVRRLILSDQARRYLALQYRSYPTEFMGCMIGETRGSAVVVRRIAPADVEPSHSTATRVVPHQTCEDAGWSGTGGGYRPPAFRAGNAVTWAARAPSTLHGRASLRLLRLGDPHDL